jgi:hypothetical protein
MLTVRYTAMLSIAGTLLPGRCSTAHLRLHSRHCHPHVRYAMATEQHPETKLLTTLLLQSVTCSASAMLSTTTITTTFMSCKQCSMSDQTAAAVCSAPPHLHCVCNAVHCPPNRHHHYTVATVQHE